MNKLFFAGKLLAIKGREMKERERREREVCENTMAPADGETSTSAIVCEFLEAAIHTTLKVRGVSLSVFFFFFRSLSLFLSP